MTFFFIELSKEIDWSKRPRFRDKELAGISFGGTPDGLIADKLVEVCLLGGRAQTALIHIEIQAQRDANFARRMYDYNYRIYKECAQPVISLALLADADPRWRPDAYRKQLLGAGTAFYFASAKLLDYDDRSEELLASHNPFALVTLAHLRTQQTHHDADQLYEAKWQLTKSLYQHRWRKTRIIVLFKVIDWMMVLPANHQRRYWQAVLKLEKERKMEWISPLEQSFMDEGWKKGVKQGREEGREEGRRQGVAAMLERQLTQRFGPVSKTTRAKLAKASMAQLEAWSDALQEAQTLKEFFSA